MAFSLSGWFKGKPEDEATSTGVENGIAPPNPAGQPGTETPRPRVTVRAVRTVTPHSAQAGSLRAPSARQAIALPGSPSEHGEGGVPGNSPARKILFGAPGDPLAVPVNEPPRLNLKPAPPLVPAGPDVKVILEVGDFVDRLPSSFLQSGPLDRQRKVAFRSSELYSDLARGRASVPASVIYQKCADIFSRPVTATEDIEVALPLQKLVEQMSGAFQPRRDQLAVENVSEIETPFLHVAKEDNARLPTAAGTSAGPIAAPGLPAAPVDPPAREQHRTGTISTITPQKAPYEFSPAQPSAGISPQALKRPPSTVRASVAGAKIRVSGSTARPRMSALPGEAVAPPLPADSPDAAAASRTAAAASPSHQVSKKTARIQLPPISLRPAGAAPKPAFSPPPAAPGGPASPGLASGRPAPAADAPPVFRAAPGLEKGGAATFRSTPPPAIKPPPPSFTPRRTIPVPPSFVKSPPPAFASVPGEPANPPAAEPTAEAPPAVPDDRRIPLKLAAILRGLPATALTGDLAAVPDDVTISLPFALIEPQLGSGRVALAGSVFREALPAEQRQILAHDVDEIPLPLAEVFANLPASALSLRADQVQEETGAAYLTPFSQKAEEDAARFGSGQTSSPAASALEPETPADMVPARAEMPPPAAPTPEWVELAPEPLPVEAKVELPPLSEPTPGRAASAEPAALMPLVVAVAPVAAIPEPPQAAVEELTAAPVIPFQAPVSPAQTETVLQALFMTEDELDAKTVVKLVSQLPGINGCTVMFGDGLRLAGNFPENGHAEGFSAMSPPFYKRTMNFASELNLGELQAFTIYTNTGLLSFFMHNDICMSVRHAGRGFLPGVREKLETVTRELAQMYSSVPAAAAN